MLQRMSEGGSEIGGREAHPIRDIGRGIAVHVNLDLVKRFGRESLGGSGPQRLVAVQVIMRGRMHVQDRMDLTASPGSGKAYRSAKIQAGVPTGDPQSGPEKWCDTCSREWVIELLRAPRWIYCRPAWTPPSSRMFSPVTNVAF